MKAGRNIYVREYQNGDFEQIAELWNELGLGNAKRGDNENVIERTLKIGGVFFVLCNNEQIIGTSWLTTDGRRLYLHHFGIKTEFQGQKFSWLLLNESLKFTKNAGLQIKLEVSATNSKAVNLYKKAGFEYLGDYDVYIIRDLNQILL